MDKIQSITEAFSMQPLCVYVGITLNTKQVAVIELETINYPINGDPFEYKYYVARDSDGNKMCQFRAETVNVIFY